MKVNTVLGSLDTKDMGYTLMHEHIMIANHTMRRMWADWINIDEFTAFAKRYIARGKRAGVRTIVDVTPFQLGRDVSVLQRVSEEAEINIIAATGYFWGNEICLVDKSPEFLAEILLRDLEKGMEGTSVKAGIIKCGTSQDHMSKLDETIWEATVIAHKETNAPIITHSACKAGAESQMKFLTERGVDPGRVIIGHIGDLDDPDFLASVADRGFYVGEDRIGVDKRHPEQLDTKERIKNIIELKHRGKLEQIVCAHDASIFIDYWEGKETLGCPWKMVREFDIEKLEFQFAFITERVLPELKAAGFSEFDIKAMLVDTPRRIFEGKAR